MPSIFYLIFFSLICLFASAQTKSTSLTDSVVATRVKTKKTFMYCPDSLMANYVNIFKECSCYANDNNKIGTSDLGLKVLNTGYDVSVNKKQIMRGSCWDFVNEVYNQAGFTEKKRTIIFRGTKGRVYADSRMLQPGDWVYHVNHSYNDIEHSAIFVCWKDFEKRIAIMLGYVGQNRPMAGYYGEFDMRSVYYITRPKQL